MLSEICSTDTNRIHSKRSLLNYLLKNTQQELISLKDSIVKLSYTNKLMNMGDQSSRRLPIRSKSHLTIVQPSRKEGILEDEYIPNNRFLSKSLKAIRKPKAEQEQKDTICPQFPHRSQSKAQRVQNVKLIKSFYSLKLIQDKLRNLPQPEKPPVVSLIPRRKTKSYSQMLNQIGSKGITKLQPIKTGRMLDKIAKISHLVKVKLSDGSQYEKIAYLQNLNA